MQTWEAIASQPWDFIVVTDRARLRELAGVWRRPFGAVVHRDRW
ncbi:MAG TPA: hypothetical protein VFQ68_41205 [Streptosporangiaceae bacterium]|nr:hypothetical protein [Streptosporangiaceae bacterium]